jgi:hypothetical protein
VRTQTLYFVSQKGKTRGQALSQRGFKFAWQRAKRHGLPPVAHRLWSTTFVPARHRRPASRAADLLKHDSDRPTKKHDLRGARRVTPLR